MQTPRHDRVLRVAELIGRPGASRRVALTMAPPEDFELPLATIEGDVQLTGVLESVVDGILVRGTVDAPLKVSCSRCLVDVEVTVSAEVVELFTPDEVATDDERPEEGYGITAEATMDLDTLLRDALAPAVPFQPLCETACQGLCPTCGINRNEAACACVEVVVDDRWTALEGLQLPPGEDDETA